VADQVCAAVAAADQMVLDQAEDLDQEDQTGETSRVVGRCSSTVGRDGFDMGLADVVYGLRL
jgi:hypothetical protein